MNARGSGPGTSASSDAAPKLSTPDLHPDLEWAASGVMALTGLADGPPRLAPGPLASCARGALDTLRALVGASWAGPRDGAALLGERAAIGAMRRRGLVSAGGSCRLLRGRDEWLALNLARPDDVGLLCAWLEEDSCSADPWEFVTRAIAGRRTAPLVDRARSMGLPAALARSPLSSAPPWIRIESCGVPRASAPQRAPRVLDLSSLWAGPLCAQLLADSGGDVVKLESTARPDGARSGPAAFFDLMNGQKRSSTLDFTCASGRRVLRALVDAADIVVESARPRGLSQLGVIAEDWVGARPGRTWLSITGYGRREPQAGWVAFGDDAAVAAGLATATGGDGEPIFCGDAIADPLAGIHGALAAWASWKSGGGRLLDLSLHDITAHALGVTTALPPSSGRVLRDRGEGWLVSVGSETQIVAPPRARAVRRTAPSLGADNASVFQQWLAC